MNRRALLASLSALGLPALTGCSELPFKNHPEIRLHGVQIENSTKMARSVSVTLQRNDTRVLSETFSVPRSGEENFVTIPATWDTTPAQYTATVEVDTSTPIQTTLQHEPKPDPEWNCVILMLMIRGDLFPFDPPYLVSEKTAADEFNCG